MFHLSDKVLAQLRAGKGNNLARIEDAVALHAHFHSTNLLIIKAPTNQQVWVASISFRYKIDYCLGAFQASVCVCVSRRTPVHTSI